MEAFCRRILEAARPILAEISCFTVAMVASGAQLIFTLVPQRSLASSSIVEGRGAAGAEVATEEEDLTLLTLPFFLTALFASLLAAFLAAFLWALSSTFVAEDSWPSPAKGSTTLTASSASPSSPTTFIAPPEVPRSLLRGSWSDKGGAASRFRV